MIQKERYTDRDRYGKRNIQIEIDTERESYRKRVKERDTERDLKKEK